MVAEILRLELNKVEILQERNLSKKFKKKIKSITKELNKVIYNIVKTSHIHHN